MPVTRYVLNRASKVQKVRVKHLKEWRSKRNFVRMDQGHKVFSAQIGTGSVKEVAATEKEEYTDAYEVKSQTSVNTKEEGKYNTIFQYNAVGIFENIPSNEKTEIMIKNSLIASFNSGQIKGRYLQKNLFEDLVDSGVKGIEIRKIKVKKIEVENKMQLKLTINNNGKEWSSK